MIEKLADFGSNIECKGLEKEPNCVWEGVGGEEGNER